MAPSSKIVQGRPSAAADEGPRKRGRPPVADRNSIALAALRLFERRGFERVTMEQIATAASVSRTTLFRLFPSKADLVWEGIHDVVAPVRAQATALVARRAPLREVVDALVVKSLAPLDDPELAEVARRRLRLVSGSLELLSYPPFAEIQAALSSAIAATVSSRKAPATLLADAIVATAFASVLWWAREPRSLSASEAVRAALAGMVDAT